MSERAYNIAKGYRYGFNGQEKDDEVSGEGNSNTAEFWQYDTRLGRRWNMDPKPLNGLSEYSCFINNPIFLNDIDGDRPGTKDKTLPNTELPKDSPLRAKKNILLIGNTTPPPPGLVNGPTSVWAVGGNQQYNNTRITGWDRLTEFNWSIQYLRNVGGGMQIGVFGFKEKSGIFGFIGSDGAIHKAKEEAPFTAGPTISYQTNMFARSPKDRIGLSVNLTALPFGVVFSHTQMEPVPPVPSPGDPYVIFGLGNDGIGTESTGKYHNRGNSSALILRFSATLVNYGVISLGFTAHRVHYREIDTSVGAIPARDEYSIGLRLEWGAQWGSGNKTKKFD